MWELTFGCKTRFFTVESMFENVPFVSYGERLLLRTNKVRGEGQTWQFLIGRMRQREKHLLVISISIHWWWWSRTLNWDLINATNDWNVTRHTEWLVTTHLAFALPCAWYLAKLEGQTMGWQWWLPHVLTHIPPSFWHSLFSEHSSTSGIKTNLVN